MRPVFFLSDFGLEDPYVGVVKAILWEKAPGVPVLDLAHALPPQDLRRAAYALFEALPYLPEQAVVLAVVDPGVGTKRRAIAALGRRLYVGPDNGLFTLAWLLDPPIRAHEITCISPPSPKGILPLPGWAPGGPHLPRPRPLRPRRSPPGPRAGCRGAWTGGARPGPITPAPHPHPRPGRRDPHL